MGLAVAVMAICCPFLTSCEVLSDEIGQLSVSVKNSSVGAQWGQVFVNVKCSGPWSLMLVAEGGDADWASLSETSGTGNKSNVILTCKENTTDESRSLKIYLDDGRKSVFCDLTQLAATGTPDDGGDDGADDIVPPPGVDLVRTGWLELPSMDNPNLEYYSHSFEMNGRKYRNYSFGYSKKDYLAVWVAYPLSDLYLNGSVGNFGWYDNPLVDDKYEPDFSRSFGYKEDDPKSYQRGHQIAKADRKCSDDACQQTYYFTNATLQMADFNGYIWANLEENMRTAARTADTLYVVTGCTLSSSPKYVSDPGKRKVPVPSGYFKAAVRYSRASTMSPWLGAAFYLEHDADKYPSKQITASESMSIDELEAKLGIDFFVNLPDKLGADRAAAVEAQNPDTYSSVWGIR